MIVLRDCQACKTELETVSDECRVTRDNREEGSFRFQVPGFRLRGRSNSNEEPRRKQRISKVHRVNDSDSVTPECFNRGSCAREGATLAR
jgi:hypothetical protein